MLSGFCYKVTKWCFMSLNDRKLYLDERTLNEPSALVGGQRQIRMSDLYHCHLFSKWMNGWNTVWCSKPAMQNSHALQAN